ncbi:MAG: bifunctional phosphopantothenoylcysteine decarboxylase/phosphopantothenate--cysteine ligase CoaBC [Bacteroidales bacterium]|nr:bifunctional phosphopantothenoylcysteine decarboxylase/phosphopantothenate--cysteine ligase CoaBC [Bacteroidales bacterium]
MNLILGITGGIAAYKAPLLLRLLKKAGFNVQCAATSHALQFVSPLTLETLSERKVYSDLFSPSNDRSTEHISLKDWGDTMVVAPASANIIGKMANGIADDALSTLLLAFTGKNVVMCPAMNTQMWENPAVKRNIETLKRDGVLFIEPATGELACGTMGKGRMAEPEEIFDHLQRLATKGKQPTLATQSATGCQGKKVLVTAGPTHERIDAVRFIGNLSSGKMGFALAEALAEAGAEVTLVAGPTALPTPPNVSRVDVESALQMYDACTKTFPHCHAAILAAAVADFRPIDPKEYKIKKRGDNDTMTLTMVQNPDILATLGGMKTSQQRLVGFALETNNELENANSKLKKKNLDFIVLNSLRDKGAGFETDTNLVTIVDRDGTTLRGKLKSKQEVARDIVRHLAEML